jgi:hypothetical protein
MQNAECRMQTIAIVRHARDDRDRGRACILHSAF